MSDKPTKEQLDRFDAIASKIATAARMTWLPTRSMGGFIVRGVFSEFGVKLKPLSVSAFQLVYHSLGMNISNAAIRGMVDQKARLADPATILDFYESCAAEIDKRADL